MKEIKSIGRHGGVDVGGAKMKSYEFVADVQPATGGAGFRTVLGEPFDERVWRRPNVGDVVPVKCDPGRQKAKFDTSAESAQRQARKEDAKAQRAAQAAQFDALRSAPPGAAAGSVPPTAMSRDGGAAVGTPSVAATMAAIRRARDSGDIVEAERLEAEFANRGKASAAACSGVTAGPGQQASAIDPLERLEKLGDLRDRGVLTDAEFAEQKAKILGEQ